MAFVRSKMINGYGPYYYLVRSRRVGSTVRQEHIAYLGKSAPGGGETRRLEKQHGVAIAPIDKTTPERKYITKDGTDLTPDVQKYESKIEKLTERLHRFEEEAKTNPQAQHVVDETEKKIEGYQKLLAQTKDKCEKKTKKPEGEKQILKVDPGETLQYRNSRGTWNDLSTEKEKKRFLDKAASHQEKKKQAVDIQKELRSGKQVSWDFDWYADIRYKPKPKPAPAPVERIPASCGHNVPKSLVMSTSRGSSCPDCYDRMSD